MSDPLRQPRPPTLEDLLRLKRAERPDADFWHDFEQGLRQKQLAAIVEPKPWWLGPILLLRKVPVAGWTLAGASTAAVALFTILSAMNSGPAGGLGASSASLALAPASSASAPHASPADPSPSDIAGAPTRQTPSASTSSPTSSTRDTLIAGISSDQPERSIKASEAPSPAAGSSTLALASTTLPAQAVAGASVLDQATILLAGASLEASSMADRLASGVPAPASFTRLDASSPDLAGSTSPTLSPLDLDPGFASLALVAGAGADAADTLADTPAVDSRHARLLASPLADSDSEKAPAHTRERVVRRLSDSEELYASVTRLGVRGDRLSLRF